MTFQIQTKFCSGEKKDKAKVSTYNYEKICVKVKTFRQRFVEFAKMQCSMSKKEGNELKRIGKEKRNKKKRKEKKRKGKEKQKEKKRK